MTTLAVGNFLSFQDSINTNTQIGNYQTTSFFFQNFFINQTMSYDGAQYQFAPFGFSGVTINRTADGTDASLVFPNNALTRQWALDAIENRWFVQVDVVLVDATSTSSVDVAGRVHQYFGQVSSGKWDQTSLTLAVGTILDAVGADIPRRNLSQDLVGNLPVTSNVSLQ
tara:strand:+ start:128 stop:634 length:507 start_codon:yes stop_codon:yes gene_type:complete